MQQHGLSDLMPDHVVHEPTWRARMTSIGSQQGHARIRRRFVAGGSKHSLCQTSSARLTDGGRRCALRGFEVRLERADETRVGLDIPANVPDRVVPIVLSWPMCRGGHCRDRAMRWSWRRRSRGVEEVQGSWSEEEGREGWGPNSTVSTQGARRRLVEPLDDFHLLFAPSPNAGGSETDAGQDT